MRSYSGSLFCKLHEKHVFMFLLFCGAKYLRIEKHEYEFVGFM